MTRTLKRAAVVAVALGALGTGGAAIAAAAGDDEGSDDSAAERVTDKAAADRASAAALEATRGGTVEEVENADDGDKGYEVEVRRADGSEAEVIVGPDFKVVRIGGDD